MKTWPWLLSKKPFTTGVFQNTQFLAALFHQLITKKTFVVGALLAPGTSPSLKFPSIKCELIPVCTWHKVHMSVPGRHQLMYYFEEAAIGKVKRSLKTAADACLRNDCSWIFPNQSKWDGGIVLPSLYVVSHSIKQKLQTRYVAVLHVFYDKIFVSGKTTHRLIEESLLHLLCTLC